MTRQRRTFAATVATWCVIALCGFALAEPSDEEASLAALRGVTTNVQMNKDGSVRLVRLSKPLVNDEHLQHLRAFARIDYLAVVCPQVTDAGIANVKNLTNLDSLLLSESAITSAGLAHLTGLTKLERLYLDDTQVGDDGIVHLSKLPLLRTLSLKRTPITDAALSHIGKIASLETLYLSDTAITDEGLAHLRGLTNLKTLHLVRTRIRGTELAALKELPALENLSVAETSVDDTSALLLGELTNLKQLSLLRTHFSSEKVGELRRALPKTQIQFDVAPQTSSDAAVAADSRPPRLELDHLQPIGEPARDRFTLAGADEVPDFQRHVIPLLGRLGCNGRACHGSFQGQGGFRLSMFGYDFDMDHSNLTQGEYSRVDLAVPADSLILNKPTSDDDHEGGLRYEKGGWEYALLRRWIEGGAKNRPDDAATFVRLEVTPPELVFAQADDAVQMRVIAVWSDGSREDVTCLTRYQTNDELVATVNADGQVNSTGKGDTHVIALYDNGIAAIPVIRPVSELTGDRFPNVPAPTKIDELVVAKLSKLGVVPSEVCTDEEFLRRVSLDLIGTLPTPNEIREFCADPSPDKRRAKIDELLERPAYVTWWTTRLCDLTGSNAGYLGGTEMAQPVAAQWRDWIERRVRENVGYDKIVAGIVLARSRKPGQTYEQFIAEQSEYTRSKDPADFAALDNPMPHYWYRDNMRQPEEKALAFGFTFLGVRLQCAQCHKHPYDQWSQRDFEQFTEFFTRIQAGVAPDAAASHRQMQEMLAVPDKLNTAALRRQSYLRIAAEGRPIPWNEVYISAPKANSPPAKLLGGEEIDVSKLDDPRQPLMQWLTRSDNPYFARSLVNRMWANYFNVGIVNPPDDMNMANPPSNKPLLDYLADQFVVNGYDLKWLHREITNSRTYQLSWQPNDTNRRDETNFSHAIIRRLPAEVIVDGILQATADDPTLSKLAAEVTNRKIGQHPLSYQARAIDYSLLIFGKPLRTTNCDCERQMEPTLLQSLYVRNDTDLLDSLTRKDGWLAQVEKQLTNNSSDEETAVVEHFIRSAYLRTLSRLPTETELADCRDHVHQSENVVEGLRDMMWALLNTQEFITNH